MERRSRRECRLGGRRVGEERGGEEGMEVGGKEG